MSDKKRLFDDAGKPIDSSMNIKIDGDVYAAVKEILRKYDSDIDYDDLAMVVMSSTLDCLDDLETELSRAS